jgi:hypothetical protein
MWNATLSVIELRLSGKTIGLGYELLRPVANIPSTSTGFSSSTKSLFPCRRRA